MEDEGDKPPPQLTGSGPTHPAALLHGAVSMAVEAGEDGTGGHHLTGLVPAMGVAQAGGVALTLPVQDRVQPGGSVTAVTRLPR